MLSQTFVECFTRIYCIIQLETRNFVDIIIAAIRRMSPREPQMPIQTSIEQKVVTLGLICNRRDKSRSVTHSPTLRQQVFRYYINHQTLDAMVRCDNKPEFVSDEGLHRLLADLLLKEFFSS